MSTFYELSSEWANKVSNLAEHIVEKAKNEQMQQGGKHSTKNDVHCSEGNENYEKEQGEPARTGWSGKLFCGS